MVNVNDEYLSVLYSKLHVYASLMLSKRTYKRRNTSESNKMSSKMLQVFFFRYQDVRIGISIKPRVFQYEVDYRCRSSSATGCGVS